MKIRTNVCAVGVVIHTIEGVKVGTADKAYLVNHKDLGGGECVGELVFAWGLVLEPGIDSRPILKHFPNAGITLKDCHEVG